MPVYILISHVKTLSLPPPQSRAYKTTTGLFLHIEYQDGFLATNTMLLVQKHDHVGSDYFISVPFKATLTIIATGELLQGGMR